MITSGLTCIVDDDADYRFLLQLLFKRSFPDWPVRFFSGGQALLNGLASMSQPPSLILLDRHMPQLDGHQTLDILKQHPVYKRIPVVMMSAQATRKEIDGCYESGVNSFLSKSLNAIALQETLSVIGRYWLEFNLVPMKPNQH